MNTEKQVLERHGYGWKEFKTANPVQKRRYYAPDGREMILPADPYSLNLYLSKGFTLSPPEQPKKVVAVEETVMPVEVAEVVETSLAEPAVNKCPECGYEAKDHVGLAVHKRRAHRPKKGKK